jgi:hypothetical protein
VGEHGFGISDRREALDISGANSGAPPSASGNSKIRTKK